MANSAPSREASPCSDEPASASTLEILTPPRSQVKLASSWESVPVSILKAENPVETSPAREQTLLQVPPITSRSAQEAKSAFVP